MSRKKKKKEKYKMNNDKIQTKMRKGKNGRIYFTSSNGVCYLEVLKGGGNNF
jgi:hypothetical protein